eukprot:CAMPEP_0172726812 /NCGR_PEP_ID=MMETSP1074-20121228/91325_1 /TAXON_ID=2916 /ORGANISM="Ceratium fusus, Strain PA161109" /LENGTH=248 /DNA_ID=CAMNT_0013553905 /DNA_START=103 /DNA_END=849 /DNA_ORIENTATION=-
MKIVPSDSRKKLSKVSVPKLAPASLRDISSVVINLDRRVDRWVKIQKSVAKQAPWLQLKRLPAVDGAAAPPPVSEVTKKWSTARLSDKFFWYKPMTVRMAPGERGCCASHIAAWKVAAKRRAPLLVLEDDAVALPPFTASLAQAVAEAPSGTGMIFLSSKDRGTRKTAGKVLMEPEFVWTTVGYLIWPAAARTFLRMLPMDMPVDNFLAWHICHGKILAYSLRPAAVRQANTWNVGSDVPHSDDVAHW